MSGSLLLLDVCSNTREFFSSMKESLQKLESSFRRRKGGESSLASEVEAFMISRKQLNKSICKRFRNLKTMEKNASNIPNAIAILTQVKEISLEIFQSLLSDRRRIVCPEVEQRHQFLTSAESIERARSIRVNHSGSRGGVGGCLQEITENQSYHSQHSQPLVDVLLEIGQLRFHCPSVQFCKTILPWLLIYRNQYEYTIHHSSKLFIIHSSLISSIFFKNNSGHACYFLLCFLAQIIYNYELCSSFWPCLDSWRTCRLNW